MIAKDNKGRTSLHRAAQSGDTATAEMLISKGADVNSKDNGGRTPLCLAARSGNTATAEMLISKGAEVNTKDKDGRMPLHRAAQRGHNATAELLISKGAEVKAKDNDGWTPLCLAARSGNTTTAELLISKGAGVNTKDNDGWTPLRWAAERGHNATAKLLISKGAEVKAKDNDGWTPLCLAARSGNTTTAELLISKGAEVKAENNFEWTPSHQAAQEGHNATAEVIKYRPKMNDGYFNRPQPGELWTGLDPSDKDAFVAALFNIPKQNRLPSKIHLEDIKGNNIIIFNGIYYHITSKPKKQVEERLERIHWVEDTLKNTEMIYVATPESTKKRKLVHMNEYIRENKSEYFFVYTEKKKECLKVLTFFKGTKGRFEKIMENFEPFNP